MSLQFSIRDVGASQSSLRSHTNPPGNPMMMNASLSQLSQPAHQGQISAAIIGKRPGTKMGEIAAKIDPLYLALLYQKQHRYEKCVDVCTELLDKNPYDEAVWSLKTRALTAQVSAKRKDRKQFRDLTLQILHL